MTGEGAQDASTPQSSSADTRLIVDLIRRYPGYFGCESHCRLRIYEPPVPRPLIVIFTELESNRGTSITNRIEALATDVWKFLERPDRQITWIEHYPGSGFYNRFTDRWQFPEHFDFVQFALKIDGAFAKPRWSRTRRATIQTLLGHSFDSLPHASP